MALGNGNVELKVTLDAQGVVTGIQSIAKAETDLKQTTEQTSQGFTTFQSTLITLNQALDLGAKAFGILKSAAGTAIDSISRGSDIDDVSSAFDKLTTKAGGLADVFLNDLRTATAGTVDDFHLQQQAIEAVRAGAKPDEFLELAKAARVLADESATNLTDELGQLSQAMETGQARMLKMKLGTIDTEKAENELAKQIGVTREELSKEGQIQAARTAIMEAARAKAAEFNSVTIDSGDALKQMETTLANARDQMLKAIGTNKDLNSALKSLSDLLSKINWEPFVTGIGKAISGTISLIEKLKALGDAFSQKSLAEKMVGLFTSQSAAVQEATNKVTAYVQAVTPFQFAVDNLKRVTDEHSDSIDKNTSSLINQTAAQDKAIESAKKALQIEQDRFDMQERFNQSLNEAYGAELDRQTAARRPYEQAVASGISAGLNGDFKGALREAGSSAGAALGTSIGGPIGGAIGAEIGDKIGKGIYDGLNHVFGGGNDKENNARKSLDQFFASIFKDNPLQVQLEKQLSTITDLNFGGSHGFDNGGFGKIFDSIEPAAREAFRGVGVAMNELLGTGEDIGSQLGHVFAENLGGDLNNLQLLVQATGKTFEEMKNSVVEAFLDGKLSALEAQTAINGVREVMEVGIPGAVGATTQAFDNLIKSTAKGGRATVDAIGDIAAEAEEKGVPSISALQTELEGAFDKEKVDKFFKALADFGITTLDQLKNSSVDTRLALAATLEGQGSFFDVAQAKVDDIVNKLNSIPERFESDYVINVKLNGTADAQTIASKAISGESFHQ